VKRLLHVILFAVLVGAFIWLAPRPELVTAVAADARPHVHSPATRAVDPVNVPAALTELAREHEVLLVYFVPADREPMAGQPERMRVAARFAADFLRADLADKRLETEGLDFVFDGDRPRVELVRGRRPAEWYHGEEARAEVHGHVTNEGDALLWSVYHEVARALGPASRRIYVIFSDTHAAGEPCFRSHGNVARGVQLSRDSGALVVSAWIAGEGWCAPDAYEQLSLFDDRTLVEGCLRPDGTRPRLPVFELVEEAFGSLTHELGHALGLLHDFRTPAEDLMARGTRGFRPGYRGRSAAPPRVWISPQNALFLRRSPYLFDDVDLADTAEPTLEGRLGEARAGSQEVPLELVATDDGELAALVFYSPRHDTILAGFEAHGARMEVRRSIPHPTLEPGALEVVAFAVDRGGNRAAILMRGDVR